MVILGFVGALVLLAQTFGAYGNDAAKTIAASVYAGNGQWHMCERGCGITNQDWGADSLTYVTALRLRTQQDPALLRVVHGLAKRLPAYQPCEKRDCSWSDVPEWDSIAASRIYGITHTADSLQHAERDYAYVRDSKAFARGACAQIHFQHPFGGGGGLKTLETDANAVKAALLLYGETHDRRYLNDAQGLYAAIRRYFADPRVPLYSVYVFDDGTKCWQVPHRFFASVNGDMIDNGLYLYRYTRRANYLHDARATEHAVEMHLTDGAGIFTDLQAENDIVEPLVEAMYDLASQGDASAKAWIVANARAALEQDRDRLGWYGRFFDGPAPVWNVTAWQTNGGLALAVAASAIAPQDVPDSGAWDGAHFIARRVRALPSAPIRFTARAIAVIGTIGDVCCEAGHARILLDGTETFDRTGIWQNKSSAGVRIPNAVLFAWRWRAAGAHTVQFVVPDYNAKEGGAYLNLEGFRIFCPTCSAPRPHG